MQEERCKAAGKGAWAGRPSAPVGGLRNLDHAETYFQDEADQMMRDTIKNLESLRKVDSHHTFQLGSSTIEKTGIEGSPPRMLRIR